MALLVIILLQIYCRVYQ